VIRTAIESATDRVRSQVHGCGLDLFINIVDNIVCAKKLDWRIKVSGSISFERQIMEVAR